MAISSSILAWKIPWTVEPGGLQSVGLQRVGHDWGTNTFTLSDNCLSLTLLACSFSWWKFLYLKKYGTNVPFFCILFYFLNNILISWTFLYIINYYSSQNFNGCLACHCGYKVIYLIRPPLGCCNGHWGCLCFVFFKLWGRVCSEHPFITSLA